ncbi:Nif11-like leader peptide family natural product precursor [Phormidesmis priestleyi]
MFDEKKSEVIVSKQVEQFHKLVLRNRVLTERLKAAVDRPSFVHLAVQIGKENGYSFTTQEVEKYVDRHFLLLMSQFS